MNSKIKLGTYKHFKGKKYRVIALGTHTETLEKFVVYKNIDNSKVWIRTIKMFLDYVKKGDKKIPRFKKC